MILGAAASRPALAARAEPTRDFALVPIAAAGAIGLLILLGRWSPSRLLEQEPESYEMMLVPVIAGLLFVVTVAAAGGSRVAAAFAPRRRARLGALLLLAWSAFTCLSLAYAPDLDAGVTKLRETLAIVVAAVTAALWCWRRGFVTTLEIIVGATCGLLAVIGVAGAGGQLDASRVAVMGGGPNVFGRMMAMLVVLSIGRVLRERIAPLLLAVIVTLAAFGTLALMLSGSRGALLAGAVGVAVVLGMTLRSSRALWLSMVSLGIIASATVFVQATAIEQATAAWRRRIVEQTFEERHLAGRETIFAEAWELFRENPSLGVGVGGFAFYGSAAYPHNLFLELLCEGGAVGGLLGASLILLVVQTCWRGRRTLNPGLVGCFFSFLVAAQVSGDLYDNRSVWIFGMMILGSADVVARRVDEPHSVERVRR